MLPAGPITQDSIDHVAAALVAAATSSSTAATRVSPTPSRRAGDAAGERHRVRRRRRERRHLGTRERLLPDGRRHATKRWPSCSRRSTRSRPNDGFAHVGPAGAGSLREDGAQRHRVRADAGLRRRLRADGRGRRVRASTCIRSPTCGATVRSCARGCSTSTERALADGSRPRRDRGRRRRLGRRALDGARTRSNRAVPLPVITASLVRPVRDPRRRRVRRRVCWRRCATSSAATPCSSKTATPNSRTPSRERASRRRRRWS